MTTGRLVLLLLFVATNLAGPDARGEELLRWETKVAPTCLAVTPDGQSVCVGGRSPYISIWDIESGELRTRLLATRDNTLADQVQEVENDAEEAPRNSPDLVDAITISPDGKLLAAVVVTRERETDTREYLSLWDLATESQIAFAKLPNLSEVTDAIIDEIQRQMRLAGITGPVGGGAAIAGGPARSVAFAPGGKHIAVSGAYASRVWDLDAADFLPGFRRDARLCYTAKRDLLATEYYRKGVVLHDASRKLVDRLDKPFLGHGQMAFSHDGQTLAIPARQELFLWRLNRRPRLQSLRLKREGIRVVSVALSEYDNCIASGYQQGTVALWTTETRKPCITLQASEKTDVYVAFGGKRGIILITATGKTIQTWHVGKLLAENGP